MTAFALALILGSSFGAFSTSAEKTLIRSDGAKITITARANWTDWTQGTVCVTSRALYAKLLPPCRVRFAATCQGSGDGWADFWDGYVEKRMRRGVRCYTANTGRFVSGRMYVVTGTCPQAGRILGCVVREVKL